MEWTNENTVSFIDDYHNSPELWNNKIAEYKDLRIKNDKLKQLSGKYNCTVIELKKIKNLRSAFHREQKKSGSSPSKKGKWFAYESFLLDVDVPKSTLSTAGSDEEDFQIEHGGDAEIVHDVLHSASQSSVPSPSGSSASGPPTKAFKSPLKVKSKRKLEDERADEAYAILKNAINSEKDASTVFGEYVATKHRKYSCYTKNVIEHLINTILYDADMGKYDDSSATSQQQTKLQHQRNLADEYPRIISSAHSKLLPSSQVYHTGSDITGYYSSFSDDSYASSNY